MITNIIIVVVVVITVVIIIIIKIPKDSVYLWFKKNTPRVRSSLGVVRSSNGESSRIPRCARSCLRMYSCVKRWRSNTALRSIVRSATRTSPFPHCLYVLVPSSYNAFPKADLFTSLLCNRMHNGSMYFEIYFYRMAQNRSIEGGVGKEEKWKKKHKEKRKQKKWNTRSKCVLFDRHNKCNNTAWSYESTRVYLHTSFTSSTTPRLMSKRQSMTGRSVGRSDSLFLSGRK